MKQYYIYILARYYIYILASQKDGVLYIGVNSDLVKRSYQHKNNLAKASFTSKYYVYNLVYYEVHSSIEEAILREKRIKKWNRQWKINLIEKENPDWKDLYNNIII